MSDDKPLPELVPCADCVEGRCVLCEGLAVDEARQMVVACSCAHAWGFTR